MTIKHIQARFTSGNEIPIDKAMVPADEWRTAMAEIQVLKDEYIWKLIEVSQLQEQNTYLDKVSAELQDLCDRQAKRLEEVEKDAARYQWVTADHADHETRLIASTIGQYIALRGKGATDAAIDAAMVAKWPKKNPR